MYFNYDEQAVLNIYVQKEQTETIKSMEQAAAYCEADASELLLDTICKLRKMTTEEYSAMNQKLPFPVPTEPDDIIA